MSSPATRRSFLAVAGAGAGGLALAACGGRDRPGPSTVTTEGAGSGDVEILNRLVDLEHRAAAAYAAGAVLLRGVAQRTARLIADQERAHARALARAIVQLGGAPNPPRPAGEYRRGFGTLRTPEDVLRLAADLENGAIAAYLEAIPGLSEGKLRQTAGAMATVEAEHLTFVVRSQGSGNGLTDAFVTGRA